MNHQMYKNNVYTIINPMTLMNFMYVFVYDVRTLCYQQFFFFNFIDTLILKNSCQKTEI